MQSAFVIRSSYGIDIIFRTRIPSYFPRCEGGGGAEKCGVVYTARVGGAGGFIVAHVVLNYEEGVGGDGVEGCVSEREGEGGFGDGGGSKI